MGVCILTGKSWGVHYYDDVFVHSIGGVRTRHHKHDKHGVRGHQHRHTKHSHTFERGSKS